MFYRLSISLTLLLCSPLAYSAAEPVGIIPNISSHYSATPQFYHFEAMPIEQMTESIGRQYVYGTKSQMVKWYFKKGAEVPLHHHRNEQITWIVSGKVEVTSQNKVYTVKAGEVIVFPPNVPHRFIALEDTVDVDFFAPVRQDWIDQTASYYQKK